MSPSTFNYYSVIQFQPNLIRHEIVNIGIALFAQNKPTLQFAKDLNKIYALDPNFSPFDVQRHVDELTSATQLLWDARVSCHDIAIFFSRAKIGIRFTRTSRVFASKPNEEILAELMRKFVLTPEKNSVVQTEGKPEKLTTSHIFQT